LRNREALLNEGEISVFTLSHHARKQALAKFTVESVLEAANNPSVTYPSLNHPNQHRHVRGDVVAVVDRGSRLIVTTYRNTVTTPLRLDQKRHAAA
jgi:hypothetical protein